MKARVLGKDEEIGQIELRLSAFKPNVCTTHTFPMRMGGGDPPKLTLLCHRSEDGCDPFDAPDDELQSQDVIVSYA